MEGRIESCTDCEDNWSGRPPCDGCEKPDFALSPADALVWQCWHDCSISGRTDSGRLRLEAAEKLLAASGGTTADLALLLMVERIWLEIKADEQELKRGQSKT